MIICSEGYTKFINVLLSETLMTEDLFNMIPVAIEHVADELRIGLFKLRVDFSPNSTEHPGGSNIRVLYEDPNGHDLYSYTRILKTPNKDRASFAVFPKTGCSWDDEDKQSLDLVIKNVHSFLQKSFTGDMLRRRQLTDQLTSLPNTTYFTRFCNDLNIRSILNKYTVIFSNLRNFNYINQQMGSRVGDKVLKEYGKKLRSFYRDDELIARFGGDNFVALLRNENVEKYLNFISHINLSVATGNQTRTLEIKARSGICPMTSTGGNITDAVARANSTLEYTKRNSDADYMYFNEDILKKVKRDQDIISYFRTALSKKEFLVYYQPKVNITTNRILGSEALVRWEHEGKIISPAEFVPVLESEGLICDLDFYVLERVCENIREWVSMDVIPAKVSVNFSKLHLRNEHLVDDIIQVITKYNTNPAYLEIELTESASSDAFKALERFVDEMQVRGICTSIDDFGTGYSSLSLLKDLHVNVIKIDKSFIDNIANKDSRDKIILASILTMVTGLGMDVIAEGCETVDQARILRDMNCNMIQGYLFDKPLPLEEYTEKLAGGHTYSVKL
ncbi:MAG: EAL domain-containing protein [Lachnospiraceae bacterium]|nr:EAL domain-containing protein [Lachnospiraceae bacterium]